MLESLSKAACSSGVGGRKGSGSVGGAAGLGGITGLEDVWADEEAPPTEVARLATAATTALRGLRQRRESDIYASKARLGDGSVYGPSNRSLRDGVSTV